MDMGSDHDSRLDELGRRIARAEHDVAVRQPIFSGLVGALGSLASVVAALYLLGSKNSIAKYEFGSGPSLVIVGGGAAAVLFGALFAWDRWVRAVG